MSGAAANRGELLRRCSEECLCLRCAEPAWKSIRIASSAVVEHYLCRRCFVLMRALGLLEKMDGWWRTAGNGTEDDWYWKTGVPPE